jgi:hypothetical protein
MSIQKITISALVWSILNLAVMVPGGPVETRVFSNLLPQVVLGFNIFLTGLILVSIAVVYFLAKRQKWAYQIAVVLGFAYFLVFLLDLARIFPVSPDPMPALLMAMEMLGLILGASLMWLSLKTVSVAAESYWQGAGRLPNVIIAIGVALLIFGAFVVYFATTAALQP